MMAVGGNGNKLRRPSHKSANTSTTFGGLARGELMARIRSSGNASTELRFERLLRATHVTGWRKNWEIIGKPDFVFPKEKVAVFIDGCFWHGHDCGRNLTPRHNAAAWRDKIAGNRRRDRKVSRALRAKGWSVIRVWECTLAQRTLTVVARLERALHPPPTPTTFACKKHR